MATIAKLDETPLSGYVTGVTASNVKVYQPDPYGTGQGDTVEYTYVAPRPLTIKVAKRNLLVIIDIVYTSYSREDTCLKPSNCQIN